MMITAVAQPSQALQRAGPLPGMAPQRLPTGLQLQRRGPCMPCAAAAMRVRVRLGVYLPTCMAGMQRPFLLRTQYNLQLESSLPLLPAYCTDAYCTDATAAWHGPSPHGAPSPFEQRCHCFAATPVEP